MYMFIYKHKPREWFVWHPFNVAGKESGLESTCVNDDDFTSHVIWKLEAFIEDNIRYKKHCT